jgi:DNA primase
MVMAETVELVKERLNVADVVRGYVELKPAGRNFKGLCPFHKEKTPSFIVSPDRGTWHCFGCGLGGDLIAFVMRREGLEFVEALQVLAERAGIPFRPGEGGNREQAILYDVNRAAKEFFRAQLQSQTPEARTAWDYLKGRGLTEATVLEFEIGFAPHASDALARALGRAGYTSTDIERAGLIFRTERGTYWDRFRGRIMFPIENSVGKTVAFTGRVLPGAPDEVGKYVNSPETPIFTKSKVLFGLSKTKLPIREAGIAVLVEGQIDLIMCYQDGVRNVVAASGTAFTPEHVEHLKRLTDSITIAFDADEAGQAATERVIDLAQAHDLTTRVVRYAGKPEIAEAKDAADIVRAKPGLFASLVAEAEPAMSYYFARSLGAPQAGHPIVSDLKRRVRTVLSKISLIASPIERAHWLHELSERTQISEAHLGEELAMLKTQPQARTRVSGEERSAADTLRDPEDRSRRELVSERLLALAVLDPDCRAVAASVETFFGEPYRTILSHLGTGASGKLPDALVPVLDLISLRSSLESEEPTVILAEARDLVRHLRRDYYREEQLRLQAEVRDAERAKDEPRLAKALAEFARISKELYTA